MNSGNFFYVSQQLWPNVSTLEEAKFEAVQNTNVVSCFKRVRSDAYLRAESELVGL
jgi:hypothetical protein